MCNELLIWLTCLYLERASLFVQPHLAYKTPEWGKVSTYLIQKGAHVHKDGPFFVVAALYEWGAFSHLAFIFLMFWVLVKLFYTCSHPWLTCKQGCIERKARINTSPSIFVCFVQNGQHTCLCNTDYVQLSNLGFIVDFQLISFTFLLIFVSISCTSRLSFHF